MPNTKLTTLPTLCDTGKLECTPHLYGLHITYETAAINAQPQVCNFLVKEYEYKESIEFYPL